MERVLGFRREDLLNRFLLDISESPEKTKALIGSIQRGNGQRLRTAGKKRLRGVALHLDLQRD